MEVGYNQLGARCLAATVVRVFELSPDKHLQGCPSRDAAGTQH